MQEKKQTSAVTKWMTLIIVAIAGGLMTKLPYLRETYMVPLQEATGATKTQLGLIMSAYGIVNFICYFPGGILADKFSCKKLIIFSLDNARICGTGYYPWYFCYYYRIHILGSDGKINQQSWWS